MELELNGRIAFVTGSSRGVGYAIAEGFVREGAKVAINGRDPGCLDLALSKLGLANASRLMAIPGDMRNSRSAFRCMEQVADHWGGLDILIANAGTGRSEVGWQATPKAWSQAIAHNLLAAVHPIREAIPLLRERSGCIVLVSSIAGREAIGAPHPYAAAKAALTIYSKGLARELAPSGIRVNAVAPGNILFPGGRWEEKLRADEDGVRAYLAREVPMNRFGRAEEVADAVLFLASARASFITGCCVIVDGGQTRGLH